MPDNQNQSEEALEAPPGLQSSLERLSKKAIFIPRATDEAILSAARRHLFESQKPAYRSWFIKPWIAATAALALLVVVVFYLQRKPAPAPGSNFAREDVNHDGQVDILDAFALARQLTPGAKANLQPDLNGDGVIDERDVALVAARAVSLEKGGRL